MPVSPKPQPEIVENGLILPFPETIDRNSFGWYLSGFTDGEGCFALLLDTRTDGKQPTPYASFAINLRRDDDGILKLTQSYFQCGSLVYGKTRNLCSLRFRTLQELPVVLHHFENFPLFAKKRKDFVVWRDGVKLLLAVSKKRQIRSQRHGSSYKWTEDEYNFFVSLKDELEQGRKFEIGEK